MNIHSVSDERSRRRQETLEEYRVQQPSRQDLEYADCVAEKAYEAARRCVQSRVASPGRYDDLKLAVEALSGGANTVLLDDIGMPSIMVALPWMRIADLYDTEDESLHPAWIACGKPQKVIYISKYMNIVENQRAYSLPMREPYSFVTFDEANRFCLNKGSGWHLMTNSQWAAIAAWCRKNGTLPRGNTGSRGEDWRNPHLKGVSARPYYGQELTLTGSGPVEFQHNYQASGIADLVGNMFEWVGGLRLLDGEIQIMPDGFASAYSDEAFRADSHHWRGITAGGELAAHEELDTLKLDGSVPGDGEERDHLLENGRPVLSTRLRNRSYLGPHTQGNQGYTECRFAELQTDGQLKVPSMLTQLEIFPDSACRSEDGILVVRNYGERIAVRGGKAGSFERAGISALHFYNPRTYDGSATIGFRCAYVNLS